MSSLDESMRKMQQSEATAMRKQELLETAARTGLTSLANFFDELVKRLTDERLLMEDLLFERASFAIVRNEPRFEKTIRSTVPVWSIGGLKLSKAGDLWIPVRANIKYTGHRDFPPDGLFISRRQKLERARNRMTDQLSRLDLSFSAPRRIDFGQLFTEWIKSALKHERNVGRSEFGKFAGGPKEIIDIKTHEFYNFRCDTGSNVFTIPRGKGTETVDRTVISGSAWPHPGWPNVSEQPIVNFGLVREHLDFETSDLEPLDEILLESCATLILNHRRALS